MSGSVTYRIDKPENQSIMFSGASFDDYYRQLLEKVRGAILGTSPDDLTEYYYSPNALQPLEVDPDLAVGWTPHKQVCTVPATSETTVTTTTAISSMSSRALPSRCRSSTTNRSPCSRSS